MKNVSPNSGTFDKQNNHDQRLFTGSYVLQRTQLFLLWVNTFEILLRILKTMTCILALKIWSMINLCYILKIIDKILFVVILNYRNILKEILISLKGKICD